MELPDRASRAWIWSPRQRVILASLVLLLAGLLAIRAFLHPLSLPDPQSGDGPAAERLATRIDPNTADAAALAALPMIGPRRAADIVEFRQEQLAKSPGRPVFLKSEDLMQVKGIGKATTQALEPHLLFPPAAPPQ